MVMPVMTKLHKLTGQDLYLQKLHDYFSYAKNLMHDPETGLFFRDAKYIYPKHKSANGMKDFWARGNAWIFAAMPKVLEDLPKDDPHRQEYIQTYLAMAATLARTQQTEGHWTRSILDPAHAPGPETSGTAFFTYGYLWGINNGLLDQETYSPVVRKSWKYLTETAIQPDGTLGYIQPIGEKAIPGQIVNAKSTADFGVGAFLLAASEMLTFIDNKP
jgi:rhamnogalacturonyl hydrolase YesR